MRVHEFVEEGLGHSSYLIDIGDGTAALVDPPRFPTAHEMLATAKRLRIEWTFDTHSHADYVTGSPGVAARHRAIFVAPRASQLETPHRPVDDGDSIDIGNGNGLRMVAIASPGHTSDHHAFLLVDHDDPTVLFSGGSLMVGTVGRTDLGGDDLAEPLARQMFRSVRRLLELPDDVTVAPTHGAGSFCSAAGASARTTTIGDERRTDLLAIDDEDRFVDDLLATYGSFPDYFRRLPEVNRRGPQPLDALPSLARLSLVEFEAHLAAGAVVVDARPIGRFSEAHVPGSLSNALRPTFASWIGWLVDPDRPLLFILDPGQERADLVRQCLDVGHDELLGELEGGIDTWAAAGRPTASIPLVHAAEAAAVLVDVRQADEYAAGHVPCAINVELARIGADTAGSTRVTFMCGHGERAMTAASIALAGGATGVSAFDGGPDTFLAATAESMVAGQ